MNSSRSGWIQAVLAFGVWAGTGTITPADVVLEWNELMISAIRVDNSGPTVSSRNLAILHTAIYDAVNSVERTHQPYQVALDAPENTSPEAAAVGAAHEVMLALYQPFQAKTEELFQRWLSSAPSGDATQNGLALGRTVAEQALRSRADDGASTEVPYIPSDAPGQWRRTPPFFRPPTTPHWRNVRPFCLPSLDEFLPGPPPALDSPEYAAAVNEVKVIGEKNSSVRSAEQTQIAVFWSDFSYTAMPPGHWFEIASSIAVAHHNSLGENARLFAHISLAQADGAIACWESKYRHNLWRPVTAIQRAGEDNNPLTEPAAGWEPLLTTPSFPSYTSGHSTFSKASAEILTRFYGTDAIEFSAQSDSLPGVVRWYASLAACADEIGMSRIYGGFHFMFDNVAGKACGQAVGDYVSDNYLLPNNQLPRIRVERSRTGLRGLRVHARIGSTTVVEASKDLRTWSSLSTNLAVVGGALISLPSLEETCYFFRVQEKP